MSQSTLAPEAAAAVLGAQGIQAAPEAADGYARFVALQLGNSARSFARLAFEEEPSGYGAALKANAK